MTLLDNYFPFDQGPGATATPANWRQMARLWYGSGVVPGNGNQLACTISGTVVTIQPGAVWVDGFYGSTTVNKQVTGVSGTGTIIARLDVTSRQIYFMFTNTAIVQNPLANYDIPLYTVAGGVLTDARQFCAADPGKIARGRLHRQAGHQTSTAVATFGFDTVDYGSNWSGYSFVCPYAADYLAHAQVVFQPNAANQWLNIRLVHGSAGVNTLVAWHGTPMVSAGSIPLQVTDIVPCKSGDTLFIQWNCSTNGLNGVPGYYYEFFSVRSMS